MTERTLCEGRLAVKVSGCGPRATVELVDGETVCFECNTKLLRHMLDGSPLQLSTRDGFCLLERQDEMVRLSFGISGEGRDGCEFPAAELAAVLNEIEASRS